MGSGLAIAALACSQWCSLWLPQVRACGPSTSSDQMARSFNAGMRTPNAAVECWLVSGSSDRWLSVLQHFAVCYSMWTHALCILAGGLARPPAIMPATQPDQRPCMPLLSKLVFASGHICKKLSDPCGGRTEPQLLACLLWAVTRCQADHAPNVSPAVPLDCKDRRHADVMRRIEAQAFIWTGKPISNPCVAGDACIRKRASDMLP
jgi:hypothetical protein